jgi:hypothetical protein
MTSRQLQTWKRRRLAVNTQPDISNVGNRRILAMAVQAGAWLRSDSIIVEEPIQTITLANRAPWSAAILEDGYFRQHDAANLAVDAERGKCSPRTTLHTLDVSELLVAVDRGCQSGALPPNLSARLRSPAHRFGYRIRPSWVWQRKRYGGS